MSVGINTREWDALSTDWAWGIGVGGDWVIHSSQEWEEYWLHGWIKALELLVNHWGIQGRNFAVATSLGASSWRGLGCWGTQSPLSLGLASRHVSGHALWSLQGFMSPSFGTSPGELWQRPEIVSLLGTLATKGARSGFYMAHCWAGDQQSHGAPHGLIRDKTSSFVFVCRIWHDGTAGTGHLDFPCLDNWYVRRVLGVLGSMVDFLYGRFWWSWLHFTGHKRAIGYNPVKDSSRKLSCVNYSLTLE